MTQSKEHHLDVNLKASYRTLNQLTSATERIWIVFHGYGQLTEYFLQKFTILDQASNFILAPQGLSKFYLDGFAGRVGATWMTKEDRLTEIENQQRYLSTLVSKYVDPHPNAELILFGFSQGVATMGRFAAYNNLKFNKMILWAGTFPHDVEQHELAHWPPEYDLRYFTGRQDPFLREGLVEEQQARLKMLTGRTVQPQYFDGKHEIIPELLLQI